MPAVNVLLYSLGFFAVLDEEGDGPVVVFLRQLGLPYIAFSRVDQRESRSSEIVFSLESLVVRGYVHYAPVLCEHRTGFGCQHKALCYSVFWLVLVTCASILP